MPRRTPPPPVARPARSTTSTALPLVLAFVVGAVLVGAVWGISAQSGGGDDGGAVTEGQSVEEVAKQLQAQERERNETEVRRLTELAQSTVEDLTPVLTGLDTAVSAGGSPADAETVAAWRRTLDEAAGSFGEPVSAATEITLARGSIASSVDVLSGAVRAYELSLQADGDRSAALQELAGSLHGSGAELFATAAVQLDTANIEYGGGHVHLDLPGHTGFDHGHTDSDTGDPGDQSGTQIP
jgi:hypothetical protein